MPSVLIDHKTDDLVEDFCQVTGLQKVDVLKLALREWLDVFGHSYVVKARRLSRERRLEEKKTNKQKKSKPKWEGEHQHSNAP